MFIEYYNLLNEGSDASVYLLSCIILIPSSILLFFKRKSIKFKELKPAPYILFIGGMLLLPIYILKSNDYRYYRNAVLGKQHTVAEGSIENFKEFNPGESDFEEFTLDGRTFKYNDYENRVGFRNSRNMGGPLYPEAYIRIFYYEDRILALWIKE